MLGYFDIEIQFIKFEDFIREINFALLFNVCNQKLTKFPVICLFVQVHGIAEESLTDSWINLTAVMNSDGLDRTRENCMQVAFLSDSFDESRLRDL
jgi:hypothetical protein